MKYICDNDFWKCLILWRRLPNSTSLCWNLKKGGFAICNCEFCWFLQSKNGSLATKAKLGKQAAACVQYSLILKIKKSKK